MEGMAGSRTASDTVRATAGSERVVDASRGVCRRPCSCSATWQWATAGTTAAKRRAAAGTDSGSASVRAADVGHIVAAAAADTAGGSGAPWWAAPSPRGSAQADGFIGASSGNGSYSKARFGYDLGLSGQLQQCAGVWARRYL